jgi:hypothetical protein
MTEGGERFHMQLRPPDPDLVFRPGVRYRWSSGTEAVVEVLDGGTLQLPTGQLVVVDPFLGPRLGFAVPLTVSAPPGRYGVSLSVARWDRPTNPNAPAPARRVAAAKLTIHDEPIVAWELGLQPGQDPSTLQPGQFFGFVVDSGSGALLDASAVAALHRLSATVDGQDPELFKIIPELKIRHVVNLVVNPASGLNVIIFRCGMGDGRYPTWVGRTASGEPACFLVDLEVFSHSAAPITG